MSPSHNGNEIPIDPARLWASPEGRRADLLRKALRQGAIDRGAVEHGLDEWLKLFRGHRDPGLLVLILELLSPVRDIRVLELAREASAHRGDGVRLEALRLLLDRCPEETMPLVTQHRGDDSLEVRMMLVERSYDLDPASSIELMFEILDAECEGPREAHALERATEFLVESARERETAARRREIAERIRELQPRFEDGEGFLDWALDRLDRGD